MVSGAAGRCGRAVVGFVWGRASAAGSVTTRPLSARIGTARVKALTTGSATPSRQTFAVVNIIYVISNVSLYI